MRANKIMNYTSILQVLGNPDVHFVVSAKTFGRRSSRLKENDMLNAGKAVKVSIYLSEGSTHHGMSRYSSILDFPFFRGVSGATVLKGVAGFGADHHLHTSSLVDISDHLPLKIEFIETREKVDELLGKLGEMVGSGMIEVQETTIAKPAQSSKSKKAAPPPHVRIEGKAKMMRILHRRERPVERQTALRGTGPRHAES